MSHEKQNRVLDFWFGEDPLKESEKVERWFSRDKNFDESIRTQFSDFMAEAAAGGFESWSQTPRGALALILLLDQFPRNVYRNDPRAFQTDAHARRIAEIAIDKGFDQELSSIERCFIYLPLEHSEDMNAQNRSVELFSALALKVPPAEANFIAEAFEYAIRHRDVIKQFGRFPHRNDILGRENTKAETAFLKTPNSSF